MTSRSGGCPPLPDAARNALPFSVASPATVRPREGSWDSGRRAHCPSPARAPGSPRRESTRACSRPEDEPEASARGSRRWARSRRRDHDGAAARGGARTRPPADQYHLGAAVDPDHLWWEAIAVRKRGLTFVTVSDWLTVCPLVCENLARPDPVTDVIRAVGPTLVVVLLLDGPQLSSRWPARYASVLADDPGCSVLTLTALGMAERSQPPGCEPSRVIALWKDPRRGLQQILLAPGASAVALTAHARRVPVFTADGRSGGATVSELVLSALEQIGPSRRDDGAAPLPCGFPAARSAPPPMSGRRAHATLPGRR